MRVYDDAFSAHDLVVGQVLLAPLDFGHRQQYLHARQTLTRLLELGVVPVVNENDAIADDEIRFGDNDRLAALVSHLVDADLLVLLTDTDGVYSADPRLNADATLIEDIVAVDAAIEAGAGGAGTVRGSGGMASKVAAARIAARSGVPTVIAAAAREGVLHAALRGEPGIGTVVRAATGKKLSQRKLWIAFALAAHGTITVDDGARRALVERGTSLLPAGVTAVDGTFSDGDGVEIAGPDGVVFAKGIAAHDAAWVQHARGKRTDALNPGEDHEVVHRDDLVVLDG
jgi:glutamate 5-kinase